MAFFPKKYFSGLTQKNRAARKKEIQSHSRRGHKNSRAYTPFKTDSIVKTRSSKYTLGWNKRFPNKKSLKERAEVTGVPLRFIKECYNRGMAAWRTGHRPGATQQQWGYARVSSFLLKGKTYHTTDSDLVKKAKEVSDSARAWWGKASSGGGKTPYKFPRRFSRAYCKKTPCNKMGFTQRASCRPYKNCYKEARS
jgi:hypothetical protein